MSTEVTLSPEFARALQLSRHIQRMAADPEYRKRFEAARLKDHLCDLAEQAIRRSYPTLGAEFAWTADVRFV